MKDDLTWRFNVAVMEWLIVLAMLVILAVVGAMVTRRSLKASRKLNSQSGAQGATSGSWHTESIKTVFETLTTTPDGLSKEEVSDRLVKYGLNRLPEPGTRGPLVRFFYQFHNVLIYVLMLSLIHI